jgi:phosphoribosyl 1,2-cyclic phosphate phosphodiesterase
LVKGGSGERILVDAGPEFRLQAIRAGIDRLDAMLLTHAHADHIHGLDDLRPLTHKHVLPVYGNTQTIDELRERFSYFFRTTQKGGGKPKIREAVVREKFAIGDITIRPIPIEHGSLEILGWTFREGKTKAAYLTDASGIPPDSLRHLRHLDLLILGALRERPHETHYSFSQAKALIDELAPRKALITHICHEHSHSEIETWFAGTIAGPAWDGMEVDPGARISMAG